MLHRGTRVDGAADLFKPSQNECTSQFPTNYFWSNLTKTPPVTMPSKSSKRSGRKQSRAAMDIKDDSSHRAKVYTIVNQALPKVKLMISRFQSRKSNLPAKFLIISI